MTIGWDIEAGAEWLECSYALGAAVDGYDWRWRR